MMILPINTFFGSNGEGLEIKNVVDAQNQHKSDRKSLIRTRTRRHIMVHPKLELLLHRCLFHYVDAGDIVNRG